MFTVESGDSLQDGKEIKLNEDQLNDLSEVQMRDYEWLIKNGWKTGEGKLYKNW